jgi:hypothetical protein
LGKNSFAPAEKQSGDCSKEKKFSFPLGIEYRAFSFSQCLILKVILKQLLKDYKNVK